MEPRTILEYKGNKYPFYKTNRGNVDFNDAGFKLIDALQGDARAELALVYYHLRDCAKRANISFGDSFEEFIDNSDPNVTDVFQRLKEEREKNMSAPGLRQAQSPGETQSQTAQ